MIPTFPSDPQGVDMTLMQLDPAKLRAPDVCVDDFYQAIARIRPSVSPSDLEQQIEFTKNFGSDG
jgi:vacuolar protein-sorting-associated protein 4